MFGWSKEYILKHLTLTQIALYWEYGYRYDWERRGYKFKNPPSDRKDLSFEEIRKLYYTKEEQEAQERAIKERQKNLYGDVE